MSIDFDKVHELRQRLFYHLSSAAVFCMNSQHQAMVRSMRQADQTVTELESETGIDKAAS